MEIFKKVLKFFDRNFWLLLAFVVLISYGQLLFMQPWEDDNALFFKLANINGSAGYLGEGPLGEGAYKYTAAVFIPIYTLFKHEPVAYFAYAIIFYFLTTLIVYKVFSKILGKRAGQVAGFLFASGYIASDGFIRLYNSVITSISVIGISLLTLFYWKFFDEKSPRWYFLSLLTFFLTNELARSRTHYLIAVIIAFELIYFNKKEIFRSIRNLIFRLSPFVFIFYRYFVFGADQRSGNIKDFLQALYRGEFYKLYGWLTGFTNIIVPEWFTNFIFKFPNITFVWILALLLLTAVFYILLKKSKYRIILTTSFAIFTLVWAFFAKQIFTTPVISISQQQIFIAFLGVPLFVLGLLIFFIIPKYKKLYLLLYFWVFINIGAYAAYNPNFFYGSVHRYLAHSFFAYVGILAIFIALLPKKLKWLEALILILILCWGLGNLVSAVFYQKNIIVKRSNPTKNFYQSLKNYLPNLEKGDVIYFDVAPSAAAYFTNAFSVAQMPEETAIAWRYGLDRYDIRRVTKFEDLVTHIQSGSFTDKDKNKIPINKFYTFFYSEKSSAYSKEGLVNTTEDSVKLFKEGGKIEEVFSGKKAGLDNLEIVFQRPIKSVVPEELELTISANALDPKEINFPLTLDPKMASNSVAKNDKLRSLAFSYFRFKQNLFQKISVTTSSNWRENLAQNLIDQNPDTFWRPDRILWSKELGSLILDLKDTVNINRFIWINGLGSSTPTEYKIQTSLDALNWDDAAIVSSFKRIDNNDLQVVSFSKREARFVRMNLAKTTNSDSPGIAEAWIVPSEFSELDIGETEQFLAEPFGFIPSKDSFSQSLSELGSKGRVRVYWMGDKDNSWTTDVGKSIDLVYGTSYLPRKYKIILPAGGTKINSLKMTGAQIPGTITITGISARPLGIIDIGKI